MTLQDQFIESTSPQLQGRVQMATSKAAQNISSEATDVPNHAARNALASRVAQTPQAYTMPFTNMLCAQGITQSSTDADIENMVSSVWNTMAGQPAVGTPV